MDWKIVFFTSYEILASLVMGLLTALFVLKILNRLVLKVNAQDALRKGNLAIGIFGGAVLFSCLLLVQSSVTPSINALRTMALGKGEITAGILLISLGYFVVFYIISLLLSVIIIYASERIYSWATRDVNEMQEIRDNNVSVAVLVSAVILGVSLFIRPSLQNFIGALVDYNRLEQVDPGFQQKEGEKHINPGDELVRPGYKLPPEN